MPLMSKRAYARHRQELGLPGSTLRAVQKAVEAGRITPNAEGLIDSDQADREWIANSSEGHRRNPGQEKVAAPASRSRPPTTASPSPASAPNRPRPEAPPALPPELTEQWAAEASEVTFNEANTREKYFKAKLAELEFNEKSGKLVPAEDVLAKWVELVSLSKTKLLALPTKIKARIPSLSRDDVVVIDELIREALEELAKEDDEEADGAAA